MKLFLARHAPTGSQYANRYVGSTDVPISKSGILQAEQLALRLSGYDFDACFCSPMIRCRQTVEILNQELQYNLVESSDLREVDFGKWEGLTFDEICQKDTELVDLWSNDTASFTFPGGEDNQLFYDRVHSILRQILNCDGKNVLVISHGGVIRVMICIVLGLPFSNYLLFNVKPATYTLLDVIGDSGVLSGLNL